MAIAILVGRDAKESAQFEWFTHAWVDALLALKPDLDIRVWPNVGDVRDIEFVMVWSHPLGALKQFPNLRAIGSLGAGVDHVLVDNNLPEHVPIVRVVDPYMAHDIVQYVTVCVLDYVKRMDHWRAKQAEQVWSKVPPFSLADKAIGMMGIGFLGGKAIDVLLQLGLHVVGWSNSPKQVQGFTHYAGANEFHTFLARSDILICMLPLTPSTRNILNKETFSHLPKDAYIINVGRGEHLVDEDLLAALASGQLSGASLDVFRKEPLASDHPFWLHPKIRVTPHIASVTNPPTVAPQMLDNYLRAISGQTLLNTIDAVKGY